MSYGETHGTSRFDATRTPLPDRSGGPLSDGESLLSLVYVRHEGRRPELQDFSHVTLNEQKADRKTTIERERQFETGAERGNILEKFLCVEAEASEWFGGLTFQTTSYDDLNGVDAVIEWEPDRPGEIVPRLGVDFTTADDFEILTKKRHNSRNGVSVKYFRSQVEFVGKKEKELSLPRIPCVVLGLDSLLLKSFGEIAWSTRQPRPGGKSAGFDIPRRVFADHPVRLLLLDQASSQLDNQIIFQVRALFTRLADPIARHGLSEVLAACDAPDSDGSEVAVRLEQIPAASLTAWLGNTQAEYFRNLAACKRLIDAKLDTELEKVKAAKQEAAVRAWILASETHRLLSQTAA